MAHRQVPVLVGDADENSCGAITTLVARLGLATDVCSSGEEVLEACRRAAPPLVVLDTDLSGPTAYEVCRELRDEFGEGLPIVFVSSTRTEPRDEIAGILLGADDYFVKPVAGTHASARFRRLLARAARPGRPSLTPREREVLELLVEGHRRPDIAERLCITRKTASTHIEHILTKLGAHSQAQAVAFAVRENILGSVVGPYGDSDPPAEGPAQRFVQARRPLRGAGTLGRS